MAKIQLLSESKISFSRVTKQLTFFAITSILVIAGFVLSFAQKVDAAQIQTIESFSKDQVFSTPMPQILGTVLGGDKVMVFIDQVLNGTADVSEGSFEYYPFLPLSSGAHSVQLRAKNSATGEMSEYSVPMSIYIEPNPSPTLLVPDSSSKLGQDRAWVGGVAQNNSLVRVFVDNQEYARAKVRNHASGTGSFSVNLSGLSIGEHVITAIARDFKGKDSFVSNSIAINISASTPAPILNTPIVNSDSGIEKPFITGLVKNALEVSIIIDDKIVKTLLPGSHSSGVASFSWQVSDVFSLGKHKIEAFASDNGKLSNNSLAILWQVGEVQEVKQDIGKVEGDETSKIDNPLVVDSGDQGGVGGPPPEDEPVLKVAEPEPEEDTKPLTVQSDLDEKEEPVVPDVEEEPAGGLTLSDDEDTGRIDADDDNKLAVVDDLDSDEVDEISPGAVVKKIDKNTDNETDFALNTSLIIGIVILIFLLLSILVWYIQEKKDRLGQKVVDIFREDETTDEADFTDFADEKGEEVNQSEMKDISIADMSDHLPGDIDVKFEEEKDEEQEFPIFFGEDEPKEIKKEDQVDWPENLPEEPFPQEESPFEEDEDDDSRNKPEDLPPPPPPMF